MSKYIIKKTNGRPIAKAARYFVLRLDYHGQSEYETRAARQAVEHYRQLCLERVHAPCVAMSPGVQRARNKLIRCAEAAQQVLNETRVLEFDP